MPILDLGAKAARDILAILGGADALSTKAVLEPLAAGDFVGLAERISTRMWTVARAPTKETLTAALELLVGADWTAGGGAALDEAARALAELPAGEVAEGIVAALEKPLDTIVAATRGQVGRLTGTDVDALTTADATAIEYLRTSQAFFVTDEIGRRVAAADEVARTLAAEGIAEGASNAVIGARMSAALEDVVVGRAESYYGNLAATFTARARNYAAVSGYAAAGVRRMRIVATLDRRTCQMCHWSNGRILDVGHALDRLQGVENLATPDLVSDFLPWARTRRVREDDPIEYEVGGGLMSRVRSSVTVDGEEKQTRALYFERGDQRILLARIDRDATEAVSGVYANTIGQADWETSGVQPPFHGRCRCHCEPVA